MIGRLTGILAESRPDRVLVDVGGVGYEVLVPLPTFTLRFPSGSHGDAPRPHPRPRGRPPPLRVPLPGERAVFERLLTVTGIGPRLALTVLSGLPAEELVGALVRQDVKRLIQIPGVGRRLAERLVVELRDKVADLASGPPAAPRALPGMETVTEERDRRSPEPRLPPAPGRGGRRRRKGRDGGERRLCSPLGSPAPSLPLGEPPVNDALLSGIRQVEEGEPEVTLRPRLSEYIGQSRVVEKLKIFLEAPPRGEAMDHLLLCGPPGLGKTTLAHIVAKELGVTIKSTSGPVIEKAGDLAAVLTNLEPRDVLFIDEIHRLSRVVEEILYQAMEDFKLDIMIGQGPGARTVKIDLAPFTLVGATTRAGLLTHR